MSAEAIIDEIGDDQGWNETSKLLLALQYIGNQGDNDAFRDFLRQQAEEENAATVEVAGDAVAESGSRMAAVMTAVCEACPKGMQVESSDNDNDSGEVYLDSPQTGERFLIRISEIGAD